MTLPHGLKRRSHQLAKPHELQQLQEDSAACNTDFCPRVFRRRFHRCVNHTFEVKNGILASESNCATMNEIDYLVCDRKLTLHRVKAENLMSDAICWSKFVLRPQIVTISYCELSPEFMAGMASLIEKSTTELVILNCTGIVGFETLFKAFPNIEHLKIIGGFEKTWVADILKHQKCPLKSLELEGDFKDGDKLFTFEDFNKLVSAQQPRLMMTLRPLDGSADAIREMLSQGDCPDLEFDDPEVKSIYVSGSYGGKNHFLYC
uniref:F-box/LRR-repeat protein 2 n=1 Tax=Panagrellus redivivus TaxID=6233 RepID=A0A7E4UUH2_PANRE